LDAAERVVPRPAHLAAHVDADRAVAHGPHVELRVLHIGLELLCEEVAQLLHREPLHVEGPQPRQVHGAVGPDREGAAELGDVEQLHLQTVAWAEGVGVVGDLGSLRPAGGSSRWARLRRHGGPPRTAGSDQATDGDGTDDLPHIVVSHVPHASESTSARTISVQQVDAVRVVPASPLSDDHRVPGFSMLNLSCLSFSLSVK